MGYDDNRPLTGVTGGGLPAEIWRQAMEDIHADLPMRPLPMIDPIAEARPPTFEGRTIEIGNTGGAVVNDGGGFRTDDDGTVRGPLTPQGTRIPIGNVQGQGNLGNAINDVLNSLFGPRN